VQLPTELMASGTDPITTGFGKTGELLRRESTAAGLLEDKQSGTKRIWLDLLRAEAGVS